MINHKIFSLVLLFFIGINISISQTITQDEKTDSLVKEKLEYIENSFKNIQTNAKLWQYGWYAGFTTLAATQGTVYFISDNKDVKQGMALGVATSSLGIAGLITNPLKSFKAVRILQKMPENTPEERKIKLQMAEKLLEKSAEREINGKKWTAHATAGAINLTSGLIVWLGFKKSIWDGLTNFAISTVIAELQIITQPKKSVKAYADYKNKYHSSDTGFNHQKKQKINWTVSVSPVGFRLNINL